MNLTSELPEMKITQKKCVNILGNDFCSYQQDTIFQDLELYEIGMGYFVNRLSKQSQ